MDTKDTNGKYKLAYFNSMFATQKDRDMALREIGKMMAFLKGKTTTPGRLVLYGTAGSGKTTLQRMLMQIMDDWNPVSPIGSDAYPDQIPVSVIRKTKLYHPMFLREFNEFARTMMDSTTKKYFGNHYGVFIRSWPMPIVGIINTRMFLDVLLEVPSGTTKVQLCSRLKIRRIPNFFQILKDDIPDVLDLAATMYKGECDGGGDGGDGGDGGG